MGKLPLFSSVSEWTQVENLSICGKYLLLIGRKKREVTKHSDLCIIVWNVISLLLGGITTEFYVYVDHGFSVFG